MGPYEMSLHIARQERIARIWPAPVQEMPDSAPMVPEFAMPPIPEPVRANPVSWVPAAPEGFVFPRTREDLSNQQRFENMASVGKMRAIMKLVGSHCGVSVTDILSVRRSADIVRARQIAMYLAKNLTLRSLPEIGRRFGDRDHTTVLHAIRKIERLLIADPDLACTVAHLEAQLSR